MPDTPSSHRPRYGQVDRNYGLKLATTGPEEDGPVWMVNLMKYREQADYADGRESTLSGREADDTYAPTEILGDLGADVVFVADVERQLLGDGPAWDRIAIVKYPTRRSFIEMQQRPDFVAKHAHKDAGMEMTIVCGCQPIPAPTSDVVVDWNDVEFPPTEDDPAIVVMHVIKYDEDSAADVTPEEMLAYQTAAGAVAVPHGVRIDGWFSVEGTIIGDGREWDQIRFNAFPSKQAFMAVVTDPARQAADDRHRKVAIADTYTMILRPTINKIEESTI